MPNEQTGKSNKREQLVRARCNNTGALRKISRHSFSAYQVLCDRHAARCVNQLYTLEMVTPVEAIGARLQLSGQCEAIGKRRAGNVKANTRAQQT